jgi:hypothetical protein
MGEWSCTSELEGSTRTFVYEHRCEDGEVVVDLIDSMDLRPETPDGGPVPPDPGAGIRCGDDVCERPTELCVGCTDLGTGAQSVYCAPNVEVEGRNFVFAASHTYGPGCDFPSVFIECETSSDCAPGSVCIVSEGEYGWAYCADGTEYPRGHMCTSPSDCGGDYPTCRDYDGIGYFSAFSHLLGWAPRTCQMTGS